jgi:Spx/MgsR family transcriptional regulator
MITLYGLKKCSTCVKVCAWLEMQTIDYQFIDYRDYPVAPELLKLWSKQLGGWEKLVNRASMTWRNLTNVDKTLSPDQGQEWINLIARYPALIRRPLTIWHDDFVTVGFNEKKFLVEIDKL